MTGFCLENALAELPERKENPTTLHFRQLVYARWAAVEVFKFINDHPELKTVEAIECFMRLMDKFITDSVTNEMRWIFCVAKDEAEYLKDWCIAEEFRR